MKTDRLHSYKKPFAAKQRKPCAEYNFLVEGTEQDGKATLIKKYAKPGLEVKFELEKTNKNRPNAVKVLIGDGIEIGYVREYDSKDNSIIGRNVARFLRRDLEYSAKIEKIHDGTKNPIPLINARFFGDEESLAVDQPKGVKGKTSTSTLVKFINWSIAISIAVAITYTILRHFSF